MAPETADQRLGEIEIGLTREQAAAVVAELDALWANSAHDGKKKVRVLLQVRATLAAALEERETNP